MNARSRRPSTGASTHEPFVWNPLLAGRACELDRGGRLETLRFPLRASSPIAPAANTDSSTADDLSALQDENAAELRERMEALRQQMEAAGTLPAEETAPSEPTPEQPTESD